MLTRLLQSSPAPLPLGAAQNGAVTKGSGRFWGVALVLCFAIPLAAQHSFTPADVEDGGKLFRDNCVACHGPAGNLVDGVDLGHGKSRRGATKDEVIRITQDGIPGTAIPPNKLTDFQAGTIL